MKLKRNKLIMRCPSFLFDQRIISLCFWVDYYNECSKKNYLKFHVQRD